MDDSDKHSTMRREQQKVVDWINCCTGITIILFLFE